MGLKESGIAGRDVVVSAEALMGLVLQNAASMTQDIDLDPGADPTGVLLTTKVQFARSCYQTV